MIFPRFNPGQPFSDISAREMQTLSAVAEAIWNSKGVGGVKIKKSLSGFEFSLDRDELGKIGRVITVALTEKPVANESTRLKVRRVLRSQAYAAADQTPPMIWHGGSFYASPDYGKSVSDYSEFEAAETEAPPTETTTFFRAQFDGSNWVVWFPSGKGVDIKWCVVRDIGNGFMDSITVQELKKIEGTWTIVGPTFNAWCAPAGLRSINYKPLVWPLTNWSPRANSGMFFGTGNNTFSPQLTYQRWPLEELDPGAIVSDCTPVVGF